MKKRMKKKGFTLIELLAVILILGIIALIAIPTVNNIIQEARMGAFKTTVNQVVKSIENQCHLEELKNVNKTKVYTIIDGTISPSLEIKGELPKNGIFNVNNNCEVILATDDNKFQAERDNFEEEILYSECDGQICATRRKELYDAELARIKEALMSWYNNKSAYLPQPGQMVWIPFGILEQTGYLSGFDNKNPVTNLCYDGSGYMTLYNKNGEYEFDFDLDDQNNGDYYCENKNMVRSVIFYGNPDFDFKVKKGASFTDPGFKSFSASTDALEADSVVTVKYVNPSGTEVASIDTSIVGEWQIKYQFTYSQNGMMDLLQQIIRVIEVVE
jgi:type IV pilus assembly protein PilA